MNLVKKFNQLSKKDVGIAGGKGASLGEMTQAKIPVPPGFVLGSKAYIEFLKKTGLDIKITGILDKVNIKDMNTIENASKEIRERILLNQIPINIKKETLKISIKLNEIEEFRTRQLEKYIIIKR